MESKLHQMIWFRSSNCCYFWNQFEILVDFNLQKSPPWNWNCYPKLVSHKIVPWGRFRPCWGPQSRYKKTKLTYLD